MEILLNNRSEKLKIDCTSLVDSSIGSGRRLEFTYFVKKWKEMKFDQIFWYIIYLYCFTINFTLFYMFINVCLSVGIQMWSCQKSLKSSMDLQNV